MTYTYTYFLIYEQKIIISNSNNISRDHKSLGACNYLSSMRDFFDAKSYRYGMSLSNVRRVHFS